MRGEGLTSFATFSPSLKGVHIGDSLPRIIIGMGVSDEVSFMVVVDMNGVIELVTIDKIVVDWRYDPQTEMWDDVGSLIRPPQSSSYGEAE